jgi:hypothetical protein
MQHHGSLLRPLAPLLRPLVQLLLRPLAPLLLLRPLVQLLLLRPLVQLLLRMLLVLRPFGLGRIRLVTFDFLVQSLELGLVFRVEGLGP